MTDNARPNRLAVMDALSMLLEGDEPLPAAVRKVVQTATLNGWVLNPKASLVVRLTREGDDPKAGEDAAKPFFIAWQLNGLTGGKPGWSFDSCRIADGAALTLDDALEYLEDPGILTPGPGELEEWAQEAFGEAAPPKSDDELIAPASARYKEGWNMPVKLGPDVPEPPQPEKRMAF